MTKEEFVKACTKSGYACKRTAEEYAKQKDEFTPDDFEEVFRLHQIFAKSMTPGNDRYRDIGGAKTTKRYKHEFCD